MRYYKLALSRFHPWYGVRDFTDEDLPDIGAIIDGYTIIATEVNYGMARITVRGKNPPIKIAGFDVGKILEVN